MKALFFDADGTIITHTTIHEEVRKAILHLREHDVLPVLSTGRSMPQIRISPLWTLNLKDMITAAGGYVIINDQKAYHDYFTKDHLKEILTYFDAYGLYYTLECNEALYVKEGKYERQLDRYDSMSEIKDEKAKKARADFASILKETSDPLSLHVNKIHWYEYPSMYDDESVPLRYKQIKEQFGEEYNVNPLSFYGNNGGGEINEKHLTKQKGVALIMEAYHLKKEDTYAIGDGENDLEMLKGVSHPIAMGNANALVKSVCEYVTDDFTHDGFLSALKHYHLL
jgi:Cof subfamily protein (haloacid dehalogenase superfamily)